MHNHITSVKKRIEHVLTVYLQLSVSLVFWYNKKTRVPIVNNNANIGYIIFRVKDHTSRGEKNKNNWKKISPMNEYKFQTQTYLHSVVSVTMKKICNIRRKNAQQPQNM